MSRQTLRKIVTIFTAICIVVTIICIGFNFVLPKYLAYKLNEGVRDASTIGIIGSADGPTAIFITSQLPSYLFTVIFLVLSMAGICYLFLTRNTINIRRNSL